MTQQEVANLIDAAKIFEPADGAQAIDGMGKKFVLIPFDDIKCPEEENFLVEKLIPRQGVVIVYGASQTFKTGILLDMMIHIAGGAQSWGGFHIDNTECGAAIYIAAEGMGGIEKRVVAIKSQRGISSARFYLIKARPALGRDRESDKEALNASIENSVSGPISVVVIDTLSQCLGGGEENGTGMQAIIGAATDIASNLNCVVVLVHHTGKKSQDPRGHSSALGNPDALLLMENDGALRSKVTIRKQKDGPTGLAFTVELTEVELGRDKRGNPITTLVVASIGETEVGRPQGQRLNKSEQFFMQQFECALGDHPKEIIPFIDGPKISAVKKDAVREKYFAASTHQEDDTTRRFFNRTLKGLIECGYLVSREVGGAVCLWKARKEEASSYRMRDRDNRDTLKGVVPSVPPCPETKPDIVPLCPAVPEQSEWNSSISCSNPPSIDGVDYREDGSVEL